jgi:hypothetical protein
MAVNQIKRNGSCIPNYRRATGGNAMRHMDLDAIEAKWLQQCGPCDGGLPMMCACPSDDYRPVMADLVTAIREAEAQLAAARSALAAVREVREANR